MVEIRAPEKRDLDDGNFAVGGMFMLMRNYISFGSFF
jgi:hypothetical protein